MTVSKDTHESNLQRLDFIRQTAAQWVDYVEKDQTCGEFTMRVSVLRGKFGKVFVTVTEAQPE